MHGEMEKKCATVMIVDDMPSNIKTLMAILAEDYDLLVAKEGVKALELITKKDVDLILLDVVMPQMDGYEVCRRLKENVSTKDIPVIFVTAKNEVEDETLALSLGAVDFLTKPVSPPVVKARVKTHLGLKAAREALEVQRQILEKQNQELVKANALREEVDRIMRHDLKSPLNAIIGFSDFLSATMELDDEQMDMMQAITDSGYRLLDMINLSLDLYKMETGSYSLNPQQVDLLNVIKKVCDGVKNLSEVREVDIVITVNGLLPTDETPFDILGEELLCYSMLNNLLKNALEASPCGETVKIALNHGVNEANAEIIIHNQGAVPEAIRTRFFEKYVTFGKQKGTGLGTYSAKLMAEVQKGKITLSTSEDTGTFVHLNLLSA
ncbi:hybrid sensor histidine kinase/response regulator [Magnetococcales bacterium HHB-1]